MAEIYQMRAVIRSNYNIAAILPCSSDCLTNQTVSSRIKSQRGRLILLIQAIFQD